MRVDWSYIFQIISAIIAYFLDFHKEKNFFSEKWFAFSKILGIKYFT